MRRTHKAMGRKNRASAARMEDATTTALRFAVAEA